MRTGDHLETAVGDGGVVERDPHPDERAVPCRDEPLVLVPCLPRHAGPLHEQHRLHALHAAVPAGHVGGRDALEHLGDRRGVDHRPHDGADPVREVDRQQPRHRLGVGQVLRNRRCIDRGELAACEPDRLGVDLGDLLRRHEVGHDEVAVRQIAVDLRVGAVVEYPVRSIVRRHSAIPVVSGRRPRSCHAVRAGGVASNGSTDLGGLVVRAARRSRSPRRWAVRQGKTAVTALRPRCHLAMFSNATTPTPARSQDNVKTMTSAGHPVCHGSRRQYVILRALVVAISHELDVIARRRAPCWRHRVGDPLTPGERRRPGSAPSG